ncbi:RNA 2',3'-cyclic phosphodiesterase [Geomicrobium sp. JCM 19038]|uniref:RNA 2',3'-cyclic phosphodiesterase n=1 Tax=Geomicrobium sp. JCM 19038 TaxID=1460635 RepID=UPI00045F37E8|nr:RNA 2',3'-cyclic phosphodiesterase [Geomicrobium sp. JCM 19038]GAK10238.1 2'-5' RNA ligase [Geomicrobium sp. JCM 19038]
MATHYFFGIHVPKETRAMILANRELQTAILPFKKQTHPSDYHITLKFFGQLSDELRNELIQSASELANKLKPFMINVEGIETFGLRNAPRVLYVETKLNQSLAQLQTMIEDEAKRLGIAKETRPYTPHITVARRFNGQAFTLPKTQINDRLHVVDFRLYEVRPNFIPRYHTVSQFTLKG